MHKENNVYFAINYQNTLLQQVPGVENSNVNVLCSTVHHRRPKEAQIFKDYSDAEKRT